MGANHTKLAISFVLPAFNEAANLTSALTSVISVAGRYCSEFEVIVVDDGSTDDTASIAAGFQNTVVVRHGRNRGYGEAVRTGFLRSRLDYVFLTDADNQFDMEELALLLPWATKVDVVAGYRRNRQDSPVRRFYAWTWNRVVRVLFYVPVRDIDCAFKLFRRGVLDEINIESVGAMVNTEIMVKVGRAGCSVVEVGVTHRPRTAGVARGAKLSVITTALLELGRMYRRLSRLDAGLE